MMDDSSKAYDNKNVTIDVRLMRYIMQLLALSRDDINQLESTLNNRSKPTHQPLYNDCQRICEECSKCIDQSKVMMTCCDSQDESSAENVFKHNMKRRKVYVKSDVLDEFDTLVSNLNKFN